VTGAVIEPAWFAPAVQQLARELRTHHAATAEHSHRIAALARRVAVRLGLSALEATEIELVAVLHDVGKLAVPRRLLEYPGALDSDERGILRSHSIAGAQLLAGHAGLEDLADAVRAVHERWDGNGYPDGLQGEEIPIASRIVAAVDAWDAMTHRRPYRHGLPAGEARVRLALGAESQFDPQVVDALLTELHARSGRREGRTGAGPPARV
jgi:HD-GYP domain-containing protein (c-di-GMP phosphodiesterase class II)